MSVRSNSQELVMRKRLPWLDKLEVPSRARSDRWEVKTNKTKETFSVLDQTHTFLESVVSQPRHLVRFEESPVNVKDISTTQDIISTTRSLTHARTPASTVNANGVNSSSSLESADDSLGPSKAPMHSEDPRRPSIKDAGQRMQRSSKEESGNPPLSGKKNSITINLDDLEDTTASKRGLIQMINNLLRSELDLPLDDIPPPRDPRRLTGRQNPAGPTSVAKSQPTQNHDNLDSPDYRRVSTLPAPLELYQVPTWSQEAPPSWDPLPHDRRPTLSQLPPHLLPPSTSSSSGDTRMSESWASSVSRDPTVVQERGSLNRAVTGLENLMEEALNTARDAAKTGRSEDVAAVLNDATLALRKASMVRGMMRESTSSSSSISSLDLGQDQDDSPSFYKHISSDTLPTVFTKTTKSSKPSFVSEDMASAHEQEPQQAVFHDQIDDMSNSSTDEDSITSTPPQLYQSTSVDSIVRDFAFPSRALRKKLTAHSLPHIESDGASSDDQDHIPALPPRKTRSNLATVDQHPSNTTSTDGARPIDAPINKPPHDARTIDQGVRVPPSGTLRYVEPVPDNSLDGVLDVKDRRASHIAPGRSESLIDPHGPPVIPPRKVVDFDARPSTTQEHNSPFPGNPRFNNEHNRRVPTATDERYDDGPSTILTEKDYSKDQRYREPSLALKTEDLSLKNPRRKHLSLAKDQKFSLGRYHKRRPIAREWSTRRKKVTATITCLNTIFIGLIAGIYAGEVPRIQYQIADQDHVVLYGNVLLFAGLAITTFLFWPLPLLHGRKPYILTAFVLLLPLQFPQALAIASYRDPRDSIYRFGLLFPRALTGLALGFANINFLPTLFDLYGVSLMSKRPHQEIVVYDDVRRQGGGMGLWLGIWTFCFSSALAIGFCIGAGIIARLDPSWGFYIVVIMLACFLFINVITPETRRSPYRRSIAHFYDEDDPEKLRRRVARGEVKLHISNDGPKWWYEEVWAGVVLTTRMIRQPGFFILMCYMGWIKAQLTLVILLLGALLSRDYRWKSEYVGLAALAVPIGAILALPLSKASCFSRSRKKPQRTDSMTFEPRLTWTSHLIQRVIFSLLLPLAAVAYCLTAPGPRIHWSAPVILTGTIGFLTDLGIAECVGLIMETFDTCDLQPGVNTRHRLVSLDPAAKRRRTNYSSFPRVCAAFFAADTLGFLLSAVATGVSGKVTRAYGAQTAIAIVAGVLLATTFCLLAALWRWKEVQVVPNYTAGATFHGTAMWTGPGVTDPAWRPVIVGNPSGKTRRMNLLELGAWSRWTEIRKLNGLIRG